MRNPIQSWIADEHKLVRVSEGLGSKTIEVSVRQFVDDGRRGRMPGVCDTDSNRPILTASYALTDLKAGEEAYANYIPGIIGSVLKRFSGPSDQLLHQTYRLACQKYQDRTTPSDVSELLGLAFRLWTAVRLSTLPTFIVGNEALGSAGGMSHQSGLCTAQVPAPPIVRAQLQTALAHYVQRTVRPALIGKLQSMMCRNRKDAWLANYLSTFMLLHNITLLIAHDGEESRCHGTNVGFPSMTTNAAKNPCATDVAVFVAIKFGQCARTHSGYGKILLQNGLYPRYLLTLWLRCKYVASAFPLLYQGSLPIVQGLRESVTAVRNGPRWQGDPIPRVQQGFCKATW